MLSRQPNDPITERAKRLQDMQWKKEAYQKVAEEICRDQSFPIGFWKVVEETIHEDNGISEKVVAYQPRGSRVDIAIISSGMRGFHHLFDIRI